MIQKLKKPISILLVFMMVVSLFTIVPISAGATSYESGSGVRFSDLQVGDTVSTGVSCHQGGTEITLVLKGGTYGVDASEGRVQEIRNSDLSAHIDPDPDGYGFYNDNERIFVYDYATHRNVYFLCNQNGELSTQMIVLGREDNPETGMVTLTVGGYDPAAPATYVAQIGTTKYETLEAAVAAAQDGETITLLANCAGNGIIVPQGKFATGLTVDFAGFTYTVDGETVGSTGTETNGFQLLKDNKITFKNGTITSEKAKILVQNYSNLTLDNMTLTLDNPNYTGAYTLSNNNGNIVIDDTTINANPAGGFAFDVCRYASYPSVNVTVKGNSQINGDVEISASGSNAMDGFSLNLESGTINDGDIVLDASAKTAMANTPEKAKVSKAASFTQDPAEGYKWVDDGEGKQTLAPITYVAEVVSGNNVGKKYETVNDAVAAAGEDGAVKLIADITGNVGIDGDYTTTLDLNGHTITNTSGSGITLYTGYPGGKTFTIKDTSEGQTGGITINKKYPGDGCISDSSGRQVIIEGGTYTSDDKALYISSNEGWTINGGTFNGKIHVLSDVAITDGTFNGEVVQSSTYDYSTPYPWTQIPAEIAISGGTFSEAVPADFCAEGYDPKDNGDGTYTVAPHEHDWDYDNVTWTFTENASHSIYAKYTLTCKTDPTHTKEQTGSGTLMSTVKVENGKFVYTRTTAVKVDGHTLPSPVYQRNVADGIINQNELKAAAKVAGEYKLANDITGFYNTVNPVDGFVLDGQKHMIKYGTINASGYVMFVAADQNTKFTLKNITLDGNKKAKWAVCAYTGNSGNNAGNVITLDTVTIQNFKSNDYVGAINAFGSSTWNLKDCTITGNTTKDDSDGLSGSAVWAGSKATINIDGGTYDEVYLHSYSGTGAVLKADGGATINNLVLDLTKTDTLKANIDDATVGAITSNEGTIPEEAVVMDPAKATVAAPEGYKWVDSDETGMKTLAQIVYVAQNTTTGARYESLEEAIAAISTVTPEYHSKSGLTIKKYKANGTIKLLANCEGNGIVIDSGSNLTIDFDGNTYDVTGDLVGSNGTESLGFQLKQNSTVKFENGTITSKKAQMIIQNYSNLTLNKMVLDGTDMAGDGNYVLSNNNGNVVINDTTINAREGCIAFDVCRFSSYPSVHVTVKGGSHINGDVEIYASKGNARDGFSLTLESGDMTGDIVVDATAQALVGEDNKVTKADNFNQKPAEGYEWKDNGNGTSYLAKIQKLFAAHSISLNGNVNLNFYINTKAIPGYANASSVTARFTWDSELTEYGKHYGDDVVAVDLKKLTPDANGIVVAYVPVNAAQMANNITAKVYVGEGAALAETDVYSVMEYGKELINGDDYSDAAKTLVKEMLNYGAMAQTVFGEQLMDDPGVLANSVLSATDLNDISEEMSNVNSDTIINAVKAANDDQRGATMEELRAIGDRIGGKWYTTSVIFLNGNTLRHYFENKDELVGFAPDADGVQDDWFHYVEKENIVAKDLDTLYTFTIGGQSFKYSVLDYAAAILDSNMGEKAENLAKALYLYNQAANAYFGN